MSLEITVTLPESGACEVYREGRLQRELSNHRAALAQRDADFDQLKAALARWEALGDRHDIQPREPGCQCDREVGDSPCSVHPSDDELAGEP